MRIVFAGTSNFARFHLEHLLSLGYDVPVVLTQPDRPSGRGLQVKESPVKKLSINHGLKIFQLDSLKLEKNSLVKELQDFLLDLRPDLVIVVAYGLILPSWLLNLPRYGCINVHASLLPRWRGAAPIQRSIEYGDRYTGVTIIKMNSGLDTGDIILQSEIPISVHYSSKDLEDILMVEGSKALIKVIEEIDVIIPYPQPLSGVTYADKIDKKEAPLNFSKTAVALERIVRALNPFPGATLKLPIFKNPIKVWKAVSVHHDDIRNPGTIVAISNEGIDIATSDGILRLKEIQKSGYKRCEVADFIRGHKKDLEIGMSVGNN